MIRHYSVMYRNVIEKIKSAKISRIMKIADCNFGFGGHSHHILRTFPNSFIQGFDLDPKVIQYYKQHFYSQLDEQQKKRVTIINDNFTSLDNKNAFQQYDFILADFGFNNFHIKTPRGFSWLQNQDLDMRYSDQYQNCKSIVFDLIISDLKMLLAINSTNDQAKSIAESIYQKKPIKTTYDLRDAVVGCFQKDKQKKIAQVFQAFRIATNRELDDIERLCDIVGKRLAPNGSVLFITFHSIQRDCVIRKIKEKQDMFDKISIESPCEEELNENTMSRSAKLLSFRRKN